MVITEVLARNAEEYPNDVALIEINPDVTETRRVTWKEYGRVGFARGVQAGNNLARF